jgi:hypothetical protein
LDLVFIQWSVQIIIIFRHLTCVLNCLQVTNKPVAVGFGISKPEHVRQVRTCHHLTFCLIGDWHARSAVIVYTYTWTDCTVGCRWGYHWQCDGEAVGWSSFSQRRIEEARGICQEHEECTTMICVGCTHAVPVNKLIGRRRN